MKKILGACIVAVALSACADMSGLTTAASADTSTKAKLKTCMLSEANAKLQAGTLFTNGTYATAKEIATTCVKKLALESVGITSEATSTAAAILSSLQAAAAASGTAK